MPNEEAKREAYAAGQAAYMDNQHPFQNPHTPSPPGNMLLARIWRAGWHSARRKKSL